MTNMNTMYSSQSSIIPGELKRLARRTIDWNAGNSMTIRVNPGVSRNASTQINVWRRRMSELTVSLAKNRSKKVRDRTRNGERTNGVTSPVHGGHQAVGSLGDAFLRDQRGEDRIE